MLKADYTLFKGRMTALKDMQAGKCALKIGISNENRTAYLLDKFREQHEHSQRLADRMKNTQEAYKQFKNKHH